MSTGPQLTGEDIIEHLQQATAYAAREGFDVKKVSMVDDWFTEIKTYYQERFKDKPELLASIHLPNGNVKIPGAYSFVEVEPRSATTTPGGKSGE